jgi:hypothetical protein
LGDEVSKLVERHAAQSAVAVLYVIGISGHQRVCERWARPLDAIALVEEVEERALRQANVLGGVHNFLLELIDDSKQVLGSEPFRVGAENFGGDRSLLSEPANEGGLVAQSMRHTEAANMTLIQGVAQMLTQSTKQLETLVKRANAAEDRGLQMLTVMHKMLSESGAVEAEITKAQGNADVKRAIGGRIANLLPALAAGLVAHKAGPNGAAHFAAHGLSGLAETLTPAQLQGIFALLNDEQRAAFYVAMEGVAKERDAKKAETPNGTSNGHA